MELVHPRPRGPGDTVHVVAPASPLARIPAEVREPAVARLTGLGLRVTFAEHARQVTFYGPHFSTFGMRDTTSG